MTSAIARPAARTRRALALPLLTLLSAGCGGVMEVPIEIPVQSKIDVSRFRRVLVAGFATEASPAASELEISAETVRLLQNQLRATSKMQLLEADRPPLQDALLEIEERLGPPAKLGKDGREQYRVETDRLLGNADFWRKVGEEYQGPLIVAGRMGFEEQNRSGFSADEQVVRDASGRQRLVRSSRVTERRGFVLTADFHFIDGRTGETLHKEHFSEEVLYGADQRVSALSSYFELMDRLLPNFLGVISPQKIRGTRVLLQ